MTPTVSVCPAAVTPRTPPRPKAASWPWPGAHTRETVASFRDATRTPPLPFPRKTHRYPFKDLENQKRDARGECDGVGDDDADNCSSLELTHVPGERLRLLHSVLVDVEALQPHHAHRGRLTPLALRILSSRRRRGVSSLFPWNYVSNPRFKHDRACPETPNGRLRDSLKKTLYKVTRLETQSPLPIRNPRVDSPHSLETARRHASSSVNHRPVRFLGNSIVTRPIASSTPAAYPSTHRDAMCVSFSPRNYW